MTTNQQPEREKEIFQNALEIESAEERQGYIKGACGADSALRARVEALLKAQEATAFLRDQPASVVNKTIRLSETMVTEGPGDRIGRYKILQQIGEGGCGVVYMAEQEEPVRRRVALKVSAWTRSLSSRASRPSGRRWRSWITRTSRKFLMRARPKRGVRSS